ALRRAARDARAGVPGAVADAAAAPGRMLRGGVCPASGRKISVSGTVQAPAHALHGRGSATSARKRASRARSAFPPLRLLTAAVSSPAAHCWTHPAPARTATATPHLFPLLDA